MLLSMTGYGQAVREVGSKNISIEVKSLNSKFLDLKLRVSQGFRPKEMEIRKIVTEMVKRGKVDIQIEVKNLDPTQVSSFDKKLFKAYYKDLKELSDELGIQGNSDFIQAVMRMPNVISSGEDEVGAEEWQAVKEVLKEACQKLYQFRRDEGLSIENDFRLRVTNIKKFLSEIEPFEEPRIDKLRDRFKANLEDLVGNNSIDENRFEQEVIFYIEKLSIAEEKVRLSQHCDYFLEQLSIASNKSKGRTLNFISQEMGREINTLGSKANSADIQRLVVQMKDELEKIKEQVANAL